MRDSLIHDFAIGVGLFFALATGFVAGAHTGSEHVAKKIAVYEEFMTSCQTELKQYECIAMWRGK